MFVCVALVDEYDSSRPVNGSRTIDECRNADGRILRAILRRTINEQVRQILHHRRKDVGVR